MPTEASLDKKLNYMYALERFGIRLGLSVMQQLMAALGNPHHAFQSVHITGTNGKGSTASFMATSLQQAGYKTGLYTSPHLIRFNERIQINGKPISNQKLISLITEVRRAAKKQNLTVTFFEFTTALAFLYFAKQKIDIAVIEVGMGGELDATNVITPLVAVITNVGLDHTAHLGKTKQKIARTKAGIIKQGIDVVTAEQDPTILKIFKQVCRQRSATLFRVQDEIKMGKISATLKGQEFSVKGVARRGTPTDRSPRSARDAAVGEQARQDPSAKTFTIELLGRHQITNACTALAALDVLQAQGIKLSAKQVRAGLSKTRWPGRLEIVSRRPFILVDGAHNDDGICVLQQFLQENKDKLPPPEVLILGIKKDKSIASMAQKIVPLFKRVITTEGNYEPRPARELATVLQKNHPTVQAIPSVEKALAAARKLVSKNGLLLITGSLYMVGDALAVLQKRRLRS